MSARLRQQILAMSKEDETSIDVPVVEEGSDSLEAQLAEVVAADQEVVEADQAVEELSDVAASVESIAMSVESALADGGLTPAAAEMFQHAMNASAHRIGFENRTPSLESFGGDSDRERATRVSLEGVKETLVRIWQAIKAAIERWVTAVRKFFYKVFAAAPKLIARARKLKEEASKKTGGVDGEAKLKLSGLSAEIAKDGAVKVAGEIKAIAEDIFNTHARETVAYGNEVAGFLKGINASSDESFASSVGKITSIKFPHPKTVSTAANASDFGVTGTHSATASAVLPGGKQLVCLTAKGESYSGLSGAREYLDKGLTGSKIILANAKGHTAHEGEVEIAPLATSDIEAIAKDVEEIGSEMVRYQQVWKGADKVKESIVAAGEEYSKKDFEKLTGEAKTLAEKLPKLAKEATSSLDSGQRAFIGYAATVGQALLAVGEKSLGHHKAKAA